MRLGACEYETFGIIHVDAHHRLIAVEDLFRGTIDRASVHPREVVKAVILKFRGGSAVSQSCVRAIIAIGRG